MKWILSLTLLIAIISCDNRTQTQRSDNIYWQDNNLCVIMKRPTMGIVELGKIDWNGVEFDNVVNDIYNECINSERNGNAIVWIRFENPQTDKYGNETMSYDDYKIATIPLSEARKYKSAKYLDLEYKLTDNIQKSALGSGCTNNINHSYYEGFDAELEALRKAAFGNIETQPVTDLTTDTVRSVNVTIQQLEQAQEEWEEWIKQRNSEEIP